MVDVVTWETSLGHVCQVSGCPSQHYQTQDRASTPVPAARMNAGRILWTIKKSKTINICPTSQALFIHTVGTIAPVSMRAVKITSIKTGVTGEGTLGDQRLAVMFVEVCRC